MYLAIKEFKEEYPSVSIEWMCDILEVSRTAYYKWQHREVTNEEFENMILAQVILHYYDHYNGVIGYRRMTGYINKDNHCNYNKKRIRRLMRQLSLKAKIRKQPKQYTIGSGKEVAENKLNRDFLATYPNQKWCTDVTEFKVTGSKEKVYLSAIIDLYDRSIVSYIIRTVNNNPLVFDTLEKALRIYPDAHPLFHSDRGFQYTSPAFKNMLKEQGMTQSMSRVGHCLDNGPCEALWGIIKSEMYYLNKFHSVDELTEAIELYIHFYNNERYQERFHWRSPMDVRNEALQTGIVEEFPLTINRTCQKYYQQLTA